MSAKNFPYEPPSALYELVARGVDRYRANYDRAFPPECVRCGKGDSPNVRLVMDVAWKGKSPVCGECIAFVTKEFPKPSS